MDRCMKKVLIVGCGAIGSLFAAHLAKGGEVEVYAFDVSQPHIDAINRAACGSRARPTYT